MGCMVKWVTAYARKNLWTGIFEFKNDYCYADTDSIKCKNIESHRAYIDEYNAQCRIKLEKAMRFHKLPIELTEPKTIKGVKKPIGTWDDDGEYLKFKTLGAKRYMYQYPDGSLNITVSGLNKKVTVPYLIQPEDYKHLPLDRIFANFDKDMIVPPQYTGKNTHTYIDDEIAGVLTDYRGVQAEYRELSCVHLEEAEYNLSIPKEYLEYILGIKEFDA